MDSEVMVTEEAKRESPVSEDVAAEIKEAVEQDVTAQEKEEKPTEDQTPVEDTPEEGEEKPADQVDEEEKSDEETQEEEAPGEPEGEDTPSEDTERTDALLTRAIRAGMSHKDAKMMANQDADALERNIELLEKADQAKAEEGGGDDETAAGETADDEEDPLAGIPDLDPELYDEEIVDGFKAVKSIVQKQGDIIKKQDEVILRLSQGGEKDWFNEQTNALNVKNLSSEKRGELKDQYEILKAGHEAKGSKVSDDDIFKQATQLVLGDEIKARTEKKTGEKLKKREQQQTVRPGGPTAKHKGDPLDEVAEELDKKFFNKK